MKNDKVTCRAVEDYMLSDPKRAAFLMEKLGLVEQVARESTGPADFWKRCKIALKDSPREFAELFDASA